MQKGVFHKFLNGGNFFHELIDKIGLSPSPTFITGISDHNMILAARKLTKKRFVNYGWPNSNKLVILKKDLLTLEQELSEVTWNKVLQSADLNTCCSEFINAIDISTSKHLKNRIGRIPFHGLIHLLDS